MTEMSLNSMNRNTEMQYLTSWELMNDIGMERS